MLFPKPPSKAAGLSVSPCNNLGDVDSNGEVSTLDALHTKRIIQSLNYPITSQPYNTEQRRRADVNGDGSITETDAQDILKYVARLITTFTGCDQSISNLRRCDDVSQTCLCAPPGSGVEDGQLINSCIGEIKNKYSNPILELPPETYTINTQVKLDISNFTLRTEGTSDSTEPCYDLWDGSTKDGSSPHCTTLMAGENFAAYGGILWVNGDRGYFDHPPDQQPPFQPYKINNVKIDHIIFDGGVTSMQSPRLLGYQSNCSASPPNPYPYYMSGLYCTNVYFRNCDSCKLTNSVSMHGLAPGGFATAFENSNNLTIEKNVIKENGICTPVPNLDTCQETGLISGTTGAASDGLTIWNSHDISVVNNSIYDNTDVAVVFQNGSATGNPDARGFLGNRVFQKKYRTFAGLHINANSPRVNMPWVQPGGNNDIADYYNTTFKNNDIRCNFNSTIGFNGCWYGILIGAHAFGAEGEYSVLKNAWGEVTGNSVGNAKMGIVLEGAGIKGAPVKVYRNDAYASQYADYSINTCENNNAGEGKQAFDRATYVVGEDGLLTIDGWATDKSGSHNLNLILKHNIYHAGGCVWPGCPRNSGTTCPN